MIPPNAVPVTLRELFEFYRLRRLRAASKGTLCQFAVAINQFEGALGRPALVQDLNDFAFASVLSEWTKKIKSPHTANGYGRKICALWRFACRRGWLKEWPESDWQLPAPTRVPRAWSIEELGKLFAACSQVPGWICGVPASGWWLSLHHVLWDSGERITAALSLRWADVDLATGCCIIRGESRKGQTRDMPYWLHPDTVAGLAAIQLPTRELVFPWDRTKETLWQHYSRVLKSAGLPDTRERKFHCLRRSVASHLAAAKGRAAATEALDHSDPRVTDAYLDPALVHRVRPAEVLWRPKPP